MINSILFSKSSSGFRFGTLILLPLKAAEALRMPGKPGRLAFCPSLTADGRWLSDLLSPTALTLGVQTMQLAWRLQAPRISPNAIPLSPPAATLSICQAEGCSCFAYSQDPTNTATPNRPSRGHYPHRDWLFSSGTENNRAPKGSFSGQGKMERPSRGSKVVGPKHWSRLWQRLPSS